MARPQKQGLDYFAFDVNFYQDIKIRKLIRHKGVQSVSVYTILLCNIYSNGYYLEWDEDLPFIISETSGLQEDYIIDVINYCVNVGLFDKELLDTFKVLSSKSIQERYVSVCNSIKRTLKGELPYFIIKKCQSIVSSEKTPVSSEETNVSSEETPITSEETTIIEEPEYVSSEKTPINSEKSTQRKEKKSKEKHSPTSSADIRAREVGAWCGEDLQFFEGVDEEIASMRASPIWCDENIPKVSHKKLCLLRKDHWTKC